VKKFLTQIPWKSKTLAVFAGKIDYPRNGFRDRNIIRITKDPTDPMTNIEFTDWEQVEKFGRVISGMQDFATPPVTTCYAITLSSLSEALGANRKTY
jgi:menaquinone-dependent protoporphyrinogen IX oxidase